MSIVRERDADDVPRLIAKEWSQTIHRGDRGCGTRGQGGQTDDTPLSSPHTAGVGTGPGTRTLTTKVDKLETRTKRPKEFHSSRSPPSGTRKTNFSSDHGTTSDTTTPPRPLSHVCPTHRLGRPIDYGFLRRHGSCRPWRDPGRAHRARHE